MTYEEILKLKEGLDNTETTEPVLYAENDSLKVVGDPNNTKVTKHNYTLTFEADDGTTVTQEYKDIYITPRKRMKVTRLLVKMMPYFRAVDDEGNVRRLNDEEALYAIAGMEDDVYDLMYDLAEELLGVPKELKDSITPGSIIAFGMKVVLDNPAAVREADLSFS